MRPIANMADLRERARRKLPRPIFDWIDGGSFEEVTLRANCADFARFRFRQRALVDVSARSSAATLLGQPATLPIAIAPTGLSGVIRARGGETLPARAAAREGVPYCLPMLSVYPIEEVVAAAGPVWIQIAMLRRRALIAQLIARAEAVGCPVLVMTVTMPVGSRLTRSIHNRLYALPPPLGPRTLYEYGRHPLWMWRTLTGRKIGLGNFAGAFKPGNDLAEIIPEFDDSATWEALEWVRKFWPRKLLVKGIVNAEDAEAAVARGVDAVSVSNHGGIQLDGAPSAIASLREVVDAVAGRAEVYLDGGIRSGQDVLKAMALGAHGCLIGRAHLFGMGAEGEAGVRRAVALLREEIDLTMALTGTTSLANLSPDILYSDDRPNRVTTR